MKPVEYIEGPKARENFERLAAAIFQVPKAGARKRAKQKQAKVIACKSSGKNKG